VSLLTTRFNQLQSIELKIIQLNLIITLFKRDLSIIWFVAVMAFQAGKAPHIHSMTIFAGSTLVVNWINSIISRMTRISGVPIAGRMTLCTSCAKETRMERWFCVTG